jgi:hypothetical protein
VARYSESTIPSTSRPDCALGLLVPQNTDSRSPFLLNYGPHQDEERERPAHDTRTGALGRRVRVMEHHRVEERRGLVGKVVARYGGEEYVAVDVRLADGQSRLFWPRDLEEISASPKAWWHLLLGRDAAG